MLADILRFNSRCRQLLSDPHAVDLTLGDYLRAGGYSQEFTERYIVPMGRAIWSATGSGMLDFPARFFVDFFERHGFLNINDRPTWRTISGGSREYARKLIAPFSERIRLSSPVREVTRLANGSIRLCSEHAGQQVEENFDQVFFACHSDQALAMLADASALEREVLGAFPYQENHATLHTDEHILPRAPLARAAWNYHLLDPDTERVALTYDMNVLQSIKAPVRFLVTLNREADIAPATILGRYTYHHPVYTPEAVRAQARREAISCGSTFFCGAYWRYGFHEDGVVSALWALADHAKAQQLPPAPTPVLSPTRRTLHA
jgi:predicted NAD/FAD-binding protein